MVSGLESLHKVLKDEKRRNIIRLLNENGNRSYTDLMKALGIGSTGKLNYHLKILNELITKQGDGQYILTEKGKLAARLLDEFGPRRSQSEIDAPFPRGYMIGVSLFSVAALSLDFGLYLLAQINFNDFAIYLASSVLAVVFLVAAERARIKRSMWTARNQMLGAKISIMFAGAYAGGVIWFFAGGLLLGILVQAGIHNPFPSFNAWIAFSFIAGAIMGALLGYLVYKRSRYSKIGYYNPFEA
jgi:hypothetical protein